MILKTYPGSGDLLVKIVKKIVGNHEEKVCADLMCCEGNVTRQIKFKEHYGYDAFDWSKPWIETPVEGRQFVLQNVLDDFPVKQGAIYICLDGIEHITKDEGRELLKKMEAYSETVILFTPTTFVGNDEWKRIPFMDHLCLWLPEDLDSTWRIADFPNWHSASPEAVEKGSVSMGAFVFWKGGCSEKELEEIL